MFEVLLNELWLNNITEVSSRKMDKKFEINFNLCYKCNRKLNSEINYVNISNCNNVQYITPKCDKLSNPRITYTNGVIVDYNNNNNNNIENIASSTTTTSNNQTSSKLLRSDSDSSIHVGRKNLFNRMAKERRSLRYKKSSTYKR